MEVTMEGMSCTSCVGRVEKALKSVEGVESAHVNLATEKATIQASSSVTRDSLIQAVTKAGVEAKSVHQTTESFQDKKNIELEKLKQDLILSVLLTIPVFILDMRSHLIPALNTF